MNQTKIDQLMKLSPKGKPLAMKSDLKPREIRQLGENVQVWAVRIFGTVPKFKNAKALELAQVCLTDGTHTIFLTPEDFNFQAQAPAHAKSENAEALKTGQQKKPRASRQRFSGLKVADFARTLCEKLPGVDKKTRLILVMFGTPENYGSLDVHDLDARLKFHPVGSQAYALKFNDKKQGQNLEFIDLASFFPDQPLEDVAEQYRLVRDFPAPKYPKENPEGVRAYTKQDALLTWRIFSSLREEMRKSWGVDLAAYRTPASCAARIYASNYLKQAPGPVTKQVRLQAMRCYWGGRIEAFFRGRISGEICVYDAVSLYPQSCINLGAMPTAKSWKRLTDRTLHTCAGGLVTVSFQFPENELHPCLPVHAAGRNYYPLSGISHCTAHEVRYAIECGAEIQMLEGWGYDAENGDTSLADYSRDMLARKNAADREGDFSARTMFKLMVNSLYGKFGQHHIGHSLDTLREICRTYNYPDIPSLENSPNWQKEILEETGEVIEEEILIASTWYPEWAALINGYARMIESRAMREYRALTGTIDSVILKENIGDSFFIEGVKFKREKIGDTLTSIRARLYVVTDGKKIVKVALHAAPLMQEMAEKVAGWQGEEKLWVVPVRVRQLRDGLMVGAMVGAEILGEKKDLVQKIKDLEAPEKIKLTDRPVRKQEKPENAIDVSTDWDGRRILTDDYSRPYPHVDALVSTEQVEEMNKVLLAD